MNNDPVYMVLTEGLM